MSSEERELLKELSTKDMVSYYYPDLINRIKDLLTKPEPEPLSDEEIEVWYLDHNLATDKEDYTYGFRDAEKAHGIGDSWN